MYIFDLWFNFWKCNTWNHTQLLNKFIYGCFLAMLCTRVGPSWFMGIHWVKWPSLEGRTMIEEKTLVGNVGYISVVWQEFFVGIVG